jgi:hypothetical protein
VPSQLTHFDKRGAKILVDVLKTTYFGTASYRMTRERCAAFFDVAGHRRQ